MKNIIKIALAAIGFLAINAQAALITLPDKPLYVGGGVRPMVMLDVTKDHQLHFKAYNDYTDLDNDGVVERTYKHSITYYGYFDTHQCYAYNTTTQIYNSTGYTANKYCSGGWAGNFLNWSTMTRMDVVRKILYGGYRSTDAANSTILERNYIPPDAHAFAKYYGGSDLAQLTPFSLAPVTSIPVINVNTSGATTTRNIPSVTSGNSDQTFTFKTDLTNKLSVGDQVKIYATTTPTKYFIAPILSISYSSSNGGITTFVVRINAAGSVGGTITTATSAWTIENLSMQDGGLTLCNLTTNANGGVQSNSQTNTNPPLIRVARGNFELWSANESRQCQWFEEANNSQSGFGGVRSNGNNAGVSGLMAAAENPVKDIDGLGTGYSLGEYIVRVAVCNATYIVDGTDEKDQSKCKLYGSSWKPVGLLQNYTDNDLIRFGLVTGSYQKNLSGGVLRKNMGDMSDEISLVDGTFKAKAFTTTAPPTGSIIKTLDRMRIFGFSYDTPGYINDGCSYQLTTISEGNCRSFGNPMSAIYYESIRYLAGKAQTAAYNYSTTTSSVADNILGLAKGTWTDPLNSDNFCSPLNVLVFNSSVSGYDTNTTSGNLGASTLADITYPVLNTTITAATNKVGDQEGLTGKKAFIGVGTGSASTDTDYKLCSAKTIGALGEVNGICPEGPATQGTYHMAGIADAVKNNKIRNFSTVPAGDKNSLKVTSYAVQLASNTPEINIPVNGKMVSLKPIYRLDLSSNGTGAFGSGAIVDFKIVSINADGSAGSAYVNWEDSQQGGDFDQDMYGLINWEVTIAGKLKITTKTVSVSTSNGQGFGYTLSGTSKDGPHFHSGIYNYDFVDPVTVTVYNASTNVVLNNATTGRINASGGCRDCAVGDDGTYVLYDVVGDSSQDLKDPLYYLAKFGGLKDKNNNAQPDLTIEWDSVNNSTGDNGSDGIPDNYFYAINPLLLESSLQQAFNAILVTSSSSSVATNSTFLRNNSLVYQAKYFTGDWSGQLTAYRLNSSGVITSTEWEADLLLNSVAPNSREILTFNETSKVGVPLRWVTTPSTTTISAAIKTAFGKNAAGTVDTLGEKRLLWVRGNATDEGSILRKRARTKLGDIIDSSPVFVAEPQSRVNDPTFDIYYANQKNREPMLYVGANDGMLHAFNANTGVIKFSYMPGEVARGTLVSKTTNTQYGQSGTTGVNHAYGVNGNPTVADVKFGQPCDPNVSTCNSDAGWKTILVGGLSNGGQGIFALDVTDPNAVKESTAASKVLWEFTDSDDTSLGYTFSQPQISRICTSRGTATTIPAKCLASTPVAVFGGGYNPVSGTASLFVVNLQTGALIKKINVTGGSPSSPNGLASVSLLDIDGDGVMEAAYAGDLLGNMWKFDLTTDASATVAFSNTPLYKAVVGSVVQPITSAPEILDHPKGGYLIMFGTGKYIEGADLGTLDQQSFYSIWDKNAIVPTLTGRTNLQAQINTTTLYTGTDSYEYRKSTSNTVDYNTKLGWYMDMGAATSSDKGERIIYSPKILPNGIVTFSSLVPAGGVCAFGGYSWNYFVDALTGSSLDNSPFDSGALPTGVSSRKSKNGIVTPSTLLYIGNGIAYAPQSGTSGDLEITKLNLSGGRTGRVSWREINK
jgi:type IV pilus assembly protein PilY1